jgi:thiosulfate/3-mercaptopyruvate sulfurtransferase
MRKKISDLIVDTDFLRGKIGKPNWVVVDMRFPNEYAEGHIPGAVLVPGWISKLYADDAKRLPTVIPRLEKAIGEMGIGNESNIIVYGSRRNTHWNGVMYWVFEAMGCNGSPARGTVHFYEGGIEQWQAEGGNLDQVEARAKAATFKSAPGTKRGLKADEIMKIISGEEKATIIDTRTADEYEGTDIRALRGGHLPNAVHIDYCRNFDPSSFFMKSLSELKSLYEDIPSDDRVITYCHTGARAAYSYLVLRALGYKNVAIYHDGWRVYGSNLNMPVENETWYDFTKVNNMMRAVQALQEELNGERSRTKK